MFFFYCQVKSFYWILSNFFAPSNTISLLLLHLNHFKGRASLVGYFLKTLKVASELFVCPLWFQYVLLALSLTNQSIIFNIKSLVTDSDSFFSVTNLSDALERPFRAWIKLFIHDKTYNKHAFWHWKHPNTESLIETAFVQKYWYNLVVFH